MRKVILFSPNGYVGSAIKARIQEENNIQLFELTRDSDLNQYKENYDILIYSAAITSGRHENADKYVQDNVVTAVTMVDFCREHNVQRIIYLSSDEIYGELNTDVVTERTVMVNPNIYATTKYLAEKIIMESEIPYYILRLPGIVGAVWGKNFIYGLMERISRNEDIELYNLGRNFNNILDIDDLTGFITILCDEKNKDKSEIFLLGNEEKIKLQEVVEHIKKLYNSTSGIGNVDTDLKRYFTLDVTKAVEYGYSSKAIKAIIDELYQIWKEKH